jgi:hypothetical protein
MSGFTVPQVTAEYLGAGHHSPPNSVDERGEYTVWLVHFAFSWRPGSHYGLLPHRESQDERG